MPPRWTVDSNDLTADPMRVLSAHLQAPIYSGNQMELLVNGDEIFPSMLSAIRLADRNINLLTYILERGDIARQFALELSEAAKRGVTVRVLVDGVGGLYLDDHLVDDMRDVGVRFAWFHPLRFGRFGRLNNRTHRKILVVDGAVGFTGGVGISKEWTGDAQDADHWRDDHFRVTGPVVAALQGAFAENWRSATGENLIGSDMFPTIDPAGVCDVLPVTGGPHASPDVSLAYWLAIALAKSRIRIATPYFLPSEDLMHVMLESLARGVELTLMVPDSHNDSKLVQYASRTFHRPLVEAGATLYRYRGTLMHTKIMIVDDTWSLIGSPNMDTRSFELNYEFALFVKSAEVAGVLEQSFQKDVEQCMEITDTEIRGRSFFGNLRDSTVALMRGQL